MSLLYLGLQYITRLFRDKGESNTSLDLKTFFAVYVSSGALASKSPFIFIINQYGGKNSHEKNEMVSEVNEPTSHMTVHGFQKILYFGTPYC